MAVNYKHLCPNCFNPNYRGGVCPECNLNSLESHDLLALPPGTVLHDRYLLGRILGVGGFGITYLAVDLVTGSKSAVKEYFPKTLSTRSPDGSVHPGGASVQAAFSHGISVFADEAHMLSRFLGEPLIVQVMESFEENRTAYFVMEYLDGVNVKTLMRSLGGKVTFEYAMLILKSVLKTLSIIHAQGLLHRDISPENIFITKSGEVKLIDFGATRYYLGEKSMSLSVILKPGFAPPEQYTTKGNQGPWTDIYALAATFYYMVSGVGVIEAPERLAGSKIQSLSDLEPAVSVHTASIVEKALQPSYKLRYQSVLEFSDALEVTLQSEKLNMPESNDVASNPYLEVVAGRYRGYKWSLPKNLEIFIGRSLSESNIILDEPSISRIHCSVLFNTKDDMFYLKDMSSFGTYLGDDTRLKKNVSVRCFAGTLFRLSLENVVLKVGLE